MVIEEDLQVKGDEEEAGEETEDKGWIIERKGNRWKGEGSD